MNQKRKFKEILGYVSFDECQKLQELAENRVCLEIGSYYGKSTVAMAETAKYVHAVDTFKAEIDGQKQEESYTTLDKFKENISGYDNIKYHIGKSEDVIPNIDEMFDLIFIDGMHTPDDLEKDIVFSIPKLKEDAIVVFHDYMWDTSAELREVINRYFTNMLGHRNTMAWFTKRNVVGRKNRSVDIIIPMFNPGKDAYVLFKEIIKKTIQPYNLIVVSKKQCASKNRNDGMERVCEEYIIMCDDDIAYLPYGWNLDLIDTLEKNNNILGVSARLMNADGSVGANTANNFNITPGLVEVGMIPTACCAFRNTTVRFDERYISAGWEDTDFFTELRSTTNGKFVINNDVKVVHINKESNNGGASNEHNKNLYMRKWGHKSDGSEPIDLLSFNRAKHITKRGCVDVGHICDIDCLFCYHKFEDRSKRRFLSQDTIMKRMKRDRELYGITVTDFTGGEPTIHPKIVELVEYGKEIGNQICIISHAQWKDLGKIGAMIDGGLYEFLISIHGIEKDHNMATNDGAFQKIMNSIDFLESKNQKWRVNCVVHKENAPNLQEYAKKISSLSHKPYNANFIIFNPFGEWYFKEKIDFQAKHSFLAPFIKEAIDIFSSNNIWTNVRYFPICMMKGYEKHVTCFPQICYDPFEWDYRSYNDCSHEDVAKVYSLGKSRNIYGETEGNIFFNTWSIIQQQKLYRRGLECTKCSLIKICDGIAFQYRERFGSDELEAFEGEIIQDPIYFRRKEKLAIGE